MSNVAGGGAPSAGRVPRPRGRRSLFRPCIDLHQGLVKQIVGGTLRDDGSAARPGAQPRAPPTSSSQGGAAAAAAAAAARGAGGASGSSNVEEAHDDASTAAEQPKVHRLQTNFTSEHDSAYYAHLYRSHALRGGHVIKLGPGNDEAAEAAVRAWPDALHVGGGIDEANASQWIQRGAEKIIVTSYLFPQCRFSLERLVALEKLVGKQRLVVDVSCRRSGGKWIVAMNRWQDLTDMEVNKDSLDLLSQHCSEFLIHAADVEGLCQGIDEELVQRLGEWVTIPTTYAGGARHIGDLELVDRLSSGRVDLTFGSALDIFGGRGVTLAELVAWNRGDAQPPPPPTAG